MDIVGGILVGGRGGRARTITVKARGYLRSKAAMSFCGKRLIVWLLEAMRSQGVREFFVVAQGKENRYQPKALVGHGEDLGVNIRYSRVRHDRLNTGSGDATLRSLEYWDIESPAPVWPGNSLYRFCLGRLLACPHQRGGMLTVAGMARSLPEVSGKYGVMIRDDDGRVTSFIE